ncbi:hypothetical protein DPMN_157686 [Dreissena polymorpha]|uniref:Uncharacterized protein n=1 Tax=Dreissena polymorpha TaxID=45954 RepID=A0A9D4EIC8_DREPO|nr:hypothetical protein DPMN_157686 [Dreissena polymorpha]
MRHAYQTSDIQAAVSIDMTVRMVFRFIVLLALSSGQNLEPQCSKFDYEEKLITKVIKLELNINALKKQIRETDAQREMTQLNGNN